MLALVDGDIVRPCCVCKRTDVEFTPGNKYTCRGCAKTRSRLWQEANRGRREINAARLRRNRKAEAIEQLGGKCFDCQGVFDPCVYDFHHIDGSKEMDPSTAFRRNKQIREKEIKKCILLCSNCHRLRHRSVSVG